MSEQAPDYLEPVIAWRAWGVETTPQGSRLRSMTRSDHWPVGQALVASCHHTPVPHPAPWRGCRCGIYGARRWEDAAYYTSLPSQADQTVAIGLVELWGSVVEGDAGWRASHASPSRIVLLPSPLACDNLDYLTTALELADYGVPVEIFDGPRTTSSDELIASWATPGGVLPAPVPFPA